MSHVLIIEDDSVYANLVASRLHDEGFDTESASTLRQGREALSKRQPDAIVLDLKLPDSDKADTVAAVKACSHAPIVVLSGSGDENTARNCISKSAFGFMDKNKGLQFLGDEVRKAISSFVKVTNLQSEIFACRQDRKEGE